MRVVIRKFKVFRAEGEDVIFLINHRDSRKGLRLALEELFNHWNLVNVNVGIGDRMHKFIGFSAGDVREHHQERRVLDEVGRYADRVVSGALEHVQRELIVDDAQVYPSVARAYDNFLLLAFAANDVLRNPRADEVRAQVGELPHLLDDIFYLVVRSAFGGWKVMECCTVRTGTQVSNLQPALGSLLRRAPRSPKLAPERFELLEGARTIYKCADFSDRPFPKAFDAALGNHREAVFKLEVQWRGSDDSQGVYALLALNPYAMVEDIFEIIPVLGVWRTLAVGFHTEP